jgi:hypothetical protein
MAAHDARQRLVWSRDVDHDRALPVYLKVEAPPHPQLPELNWDVSQHLARSAAAASLAIHRAGSQPSKNAWSGRNRACSISAGGNIILAHGYR